MTGNGKEQRSQSYWQKRINTERHYVEGTEWLVKHAEEVRLLEVFPVNIHKTGAKAKLIAYLGDGRIYSTRFADYEEASNFVTRAVFNNTNKEIHSS